MRERGFATLCSQLTAHQLNDRDPFEPLRYHVAGQQLIESKQVLHNSLSAFRFFSSRERRSRGTLHAFQRARLWRAEKFGVRLKQPGDETQTSAERVPYRALELQQHGVEPACRYGSGHYQSSHWYHQHPRICSVSS
jgi:hypothetical protein